MGRAWFPFRSTGTAQPEPPAQLSQASPALLSQALHPQSPRPPPPPPPCRGNELPGGGSGCGDGVLSSLPGQDVKWSWESWGFPSAWAGLSALSFCFASEPPGSWMGCPAPLTHSPTGATPAGALPGLSLCSALRWGSETTRGAHWESSQAARTPTGSTSLCPHRLLQNARGFPPAS